MKRRIIPYLLIPFATLAGVPIEWSVDVTRVDPVRLDAYHGETLDLSATLLQGRRPLSVPAGSASFLWQTNGMGSAWWQTNATISATGVVCSTFCPAMDTGADTVRFFFSVVSGSGANYRAAGTIMLRPSPGAIPTTAELAPQTAINFADYQLVNAPWITAGDAAESVRAATNAIATAMQASDEALSRTLADAARSATNYSDSVSAAGNAALVSATNSLASGGAQLVATAAQAASNYTDSAIASIEIPSLSGYATEAWVQGRGYLTQHQSLSGYATEAWVGNHLTNIQASIPSLDGYATKSFVTNQGYLTAHQPLAGYATEAWVEGRGYLTQHQSLAGYATETYAQSAASGAQAAAESYARGLAWATSAGSTRLVSLDGATWQDATGTIWQVSAVYGWAGTVVDLATTTARQIQFAPVPGSNGVWTAGNGTNLVYDATGMQSYYLDFGEWTSYEINNAPLSATNVAFNTAYDLYALYYSPVSLVTNPVDRVLYASSGAADRALSVGTPTRWTDANGCVWEMEQRLMGDLYLAEDNEFENKSGPYGFDEDSYVVPSGSGYVLWINDYGEMEGFQMSELSGHEGWWKEQRSYGTFFLKPSYEAVTNLITRVAYTNDTAPLAAAVTNLQVESALVYRLYSGSNVVAEVTNYNSQVHAPALRLMQLNESNEYVTVWTETNGLARTLKRANEYTDDATGAVARAAAPRAWGRTTSGLGADAPSNTTWISTEKLVIASGLEYVHIDSAGVWILCANGQVDFSTPTNSFFSISTDSGENVFSVERTDSRPIPVDCGGINVVDSGDNKVVTIPVQVFDATENANEPPFLNVGLDLKGPWYSETNGIPSTVVSSCTWSGQNGAWTNTIVLSASHPRAFFNYSKWQAGGTVIRNKAAMEASGGILCTDGIHKGRPVYNNGTIIWEVVP